ncbi:MAG: formate dehydrogenase accessory sulfurtransferase FdhD [Flavobacteriales bacterium]|nr:formate dehydrogenase accessory sulfurtransferase FdhD [Flavobacteriales bacterium]
MLLSGRISFELVQKSAVAGIPVIMAFGAPSSLAIELAQEMNITLIGFLKKDRFNIYTGKQRIQ